MPGQGTNQPREPHPSQKHHEGSSGTPDWDSKPMTELADRQSQIFIKGGA